MKIAIIVVCLLLATSCYARQAYNQQEQRWETIPNDGQYETKYNQYTQEWSYQPPNAKLEYNQQEQRWEWDSGRGN